jgi:hypothetical protein
MKLLRVADVTFLLGALESHARQKLALTVEDAVRIVRENSKRLHASQMKVDAAEGQPVMTSTKLAGAFERGDGT